MTAMVMMMPVMMMMMMIKPLGPRLSAQGSFAVVCFAVGAGAASSFGEVP